MKLFSLALLNLLVAAGIILRRAEFNCDPKSPRYIRGYTGCLRGETCNSLGNCTTHVSIPGDLLPLTDRTAATLGFLRKLDYSLDGRCGKDNNNLTCDPNSAVYNGTCCSSHDWCRNTPDYCGEGCQSGCSNGSVAPGSPETPSATLSQPAISASQEPVLGSPTSVAGSSGWPTTDGTCGAQNGDKACGDSSNGLCCSVFGFCGGTSGHCGDGCQSGPCQGLPVQPVPGPVPAPINSNGGSLKVVGQSGVPAMHAGLMPNGRVIFLDKVENYTQMKLGNGQYAYSSEYDPATNQVTGLSYRTNAFCSGGAFLPDGRWLSLGGNGPLEWLDSTVGDGFDAIRYIQRSTTDDTLNGSGWDEPGNKLASRRWYASAQAMPDGSIFVASGSLNGLDPSVPTNNNPTWELLDSKGISNGESVPMELLVKNQPYYMYPFVHLMRDGNLFIFVSKSSQSFSVSENATMKSYPDLPGDYRTYPNTGTSVLLPLSSAVNWNPDILICGGGSYQDITSPTDASCGRIKPLDDQPKWELDAMPEGRCMVEGTLLPDGTVVFVNGANSGAQGFGLATDPTYEVLLYDPTAELGKRWSAGPVSDIARLYHSVALLLLDGTLMIAGSNPVEMPLLRPVPGQKPSEDYVTEFRVEIYTPPYLSGINADKRPTDIELSSTELKVNTSFEVTFKAVEGSQTASVVLYHGGFVTHSLHMNHRMAVLDTEGFQVGNEGQKVTVSMPPSTNVIPPGPYVVYVLVDGVPGIGQFVSVRS